MIRYFINFEITRRIKGTQIIGDNEYELPIREVTIEKEEEYNTLEEVSERVNYLIDKHIEILSVVKVENDEEEELDWLYTTV